jgi:hypothetical protein
MEPDVIHVQALPHWALQVEFADGTSGKVKFQKSHFTGVFQALLDPEIFNRVHVEGGAVTWPGNVDLAPDAMYQAIKTHGEWVLR